VLHMMELGGVRCVGRLNFKCFLENKKGLIMMRMEVFLFSCHSYIMMGASILFSFSYSCSVFGVLAGVSLSFLL
jgi:hypothetical protein